MSHPTGIVIGEHVQSSRTSRLKIMHGATVGEDLGRKRSEHGAIFYQPYFNGAVFLGINSIVIGPIELIGDIFIASNAVVNKSIGSGVYYGANSGRKELQQQHRLELRI